MNQLDIDFDPKTLSRRADPGTSHAAASECKSFRARHISLIWNALKDFGPMNKDEISTVTKLDDVAIARRLKEMEDRKLIRRTELTRPSKAGRQATVWKAK